MNCIGFIGLGAMGLPLAARLARHTDCRVRAYDPDAAACRRLSERAEDVEIVGSAGAAARGAQLVAVCLPSADIARGVFAELAGREAEGQFWVDFSFHDVAAALALAQKAEEVRAHYIEAPVVGGIPQAESGTLRVLVSSSLIVECGDLPGPVRQVLDAISSGIHLCGRPGRANAMKALQNGLGLMQLAAIAEVIAACDRVGIDRTEFRQFVEDAPGMANTPLFKRVAADMCAESAELSAKLSIAAKDMTIARDLMRSNGARCDLADLAASLFTEAMAAELSDVDFSRIVEIYRASDR